MADVVIQTIDAEIKRLENELHRLRNLKRVAKGSTVLDEGISTDIIVDYLAKHPDSTINGMAMKLGYTYDQTKDAVHVAERAKDIVRSDATRKRHIRYRVPEPKSGTPKAEVVATAKARIKPKGKRASKKQVETRNRMITDYLQSHPGYHSIKEIETATQIKSIGYVRKFLRKNIAVFSENEDYITGANGKRIKGTVFAYRRETKVVPGAGVEDGRLRTEANRPPNPATWS